jgi:hypothetical protein
MWEEKLTLFKGTLDVAIMDIGPSKGMVLANITVASSRVRSSDVFVIPLARDGTHKSFCNLRNSDEYYIWKQSLRRTWNAPAVQLYKLFPSVHPIAPATSSSCIFKSFLQLYTVAFEYSREATSVKRVPAAVVKTKQSVAVCPD